MASRQIEMRVFLYQIKPEIWRRVAVPMEYTFAQLHQVIQAAMGWEDKYPHEFRHGKKKRLVDVIGPVGLADVIPQGGEFQDEEQVTITQFMGRRKGVVRLLYRYDFAEDWIHEVAFDQGTISEGDGEPVMLDGARACPPEDFGGPIHYMEALTGLIAWDLPGYDPEKFDPAAVDFTPRKRKKSRH